MTKSSRDTKVILVVQTVVNRSVAKVFQGSGFQTDMKEAVRKCVAKPHVFIDVATCTIDDPALTVSVVKVKKNEDERCSLDKAKMEQYRNV